MSVFVAIDLAGSAARSSFVTTIESLAGKATHELSRSGGLDPTRLRTALEIPGVLAAHPVLEGLVQVVDVEAARQSFRSAGEGARKYPPVRVLGIDPFFSRPFFAEAGSDSLVSPVDLTDFLSVPGSAIVPERWAGDVGVVAGDVLVVGAAGRASRLRVLKTYELQVLGEAARSTVVVDLATAQEVLARLETVDRIELILEEGAEATVRGALLPGEQLERPGQRGQRVGRLIDAFRLNLLALGSLAWIVGGLLVFNAAQFRVVRRRPLLGQLRSLGVPRSTLLVAVLVEIALFGLVGGLIGLAFGTALAQQLIAPIAQTIRELYAFVDVTRAPLGVGLSVLVVLFSTLIAMAAGWFPAREAARSAPRGVGLRSRQEVAFRSRRRRLCISTACGAVLALGALGMDVRSWWPGLLAALGTLWAAAALLPLLLEGMLPVLARSSERLGFVTLALATGAIRRSLSRTGAAIAALAVALSMSVGVIVMVFSFEVEVRRWIEATLRADLFIGDSGEALAQDQARIPSTACDAILGLPGLAGFDTLRARELPFEDRSIFFCGLEMSLPRSWERLELLEGERASARAALAEGAALISEPLSKRYDLHVGDTLDLPGRTQREVFPIVGVFRDFSRDRGYGFTSSERFIGAFGDPGIRNIAIYLKPGIDAEVAAADLRDRLSGEYLLEVRSNRDLRRAIFDVFERTFSITYLLQAISTSLALAGVAITLLALFVERSREIATLRAIGASKRTVAKLFALEALLMAGIPALVALPLGAAIAWILVHVVNLRAFGWTLDLGWPWGAMLTTSALAVVAGLIATLVPLTFLKRQSIARALREE